jgi:LCP family protein required for cell wall assembly
MRIFGSNGRGKHASAVSVMRKGNASKRDTGGGCGKRKPRTLRRTLFRIGTVILAVIAAVVVGVYVLFKLGLLSGEPPDVNDGVRRTPAVTSPAAPAQAGEDPSPTGSPGSESATPAGRRDGVYTFLILGMDDGNNNTDTFMTATLDTVNYTLNVVNIPRDTLVNVSWNTKKINTLYANLGIEGTVERLSAILGYKVDRYAIIDMQAFKALVNAIGGVDFDVPVNMNYDDPYQGLSIHYSKGMHHLNGQQALEVVRFRGYNAADIRRISTQQDFLMTAIKQILAAKNSLKVTDIAGIFMKYVKTDLELRNIIWLAAELFKLNPENITFTTLPVDTSGSTYVTIYVNDWLELVNSKLNPFLEPIRADELSILTKSSSGGYYSTDGHYEGNNQSWAQGSGRSSSQSQSSSGGNASSSPSPSASSSPSPTPTGSPEPTDGGEPTDSGGENTGAEGAQPTGSAPPTETAAPNTGEGSEGTPPPVEDPPADPTPAQPSTPDPSGGEPSDNTGDDAPPDWLG